MNNARPDAILFDVYDTLFDNSIAEWRRLFDDICREQRLPLRGGQLWRPWKRREMDFRAARTNLADPDGSPPFRTYARAWEECFAEAFAELRLTGDAALASRRAVRHMASRPPFPETREALERLKGRVRLGVLSNADDAFLYPLLQRHRLEFEAAVSSESAKAYKPHPGAFHCLLDMMKLRPARTWYVGDHLFDDILGAQRAGMVAVWVNRSGAAPRGAAKPDYAISDLRELPLILDNLTGRDRTSAPSRALVADPGGGTTT